MMIQLDTVLIDYVRMTSRREETATQWWKSLVEQAREEKQILTDGAFLQFVGKSMSAREGGSVFVGQYDGDYDTWSLIQASGAVSDNCSRWLLGKKRLHAAQCTRIDIQATVEEPKGWSQWEFMKRMKERGRNVTFHSSIDKATRHELATVYIGSRASERITRVYEKLTSGGAKLLRFETEYKGRRADNVANMLSHNPLKARDYIAHEIQATRDAELEALFSTVTVGASPDAGRFKRAKTDLDKQGEWLRDGVLPAFARYVASHDHRVDIVELFVQVLRAENVIE